MTRVREKSRPKVLTGVTHSTSEELNFDFEVRKQPLLFYLHFLLKNLKAVHVSNISKKMLAAETSISILLSEKKEVSLA